MDAAPRGASPRRGKVAQAPLRAADFEAVNRVALANLDTLCARWLPGGRRQGHEWCCGSLAGEAGRSCSVNLQTGRWADFATGEKGGDVISLAAAVHRLSQSDAARSLAGMFGINLGSQADV